MDRKDMRMKRKIGAILCALAVIIYAVWYIFFCIWMYEDLATSGSSSYWVLLYGLIPIALLVGIIIALRMRIKEIEKGEIDEANKY